MERSQAALKSAVVIVKSTGGLFPHTHKLEIPLAALKPPAAPITLETSDEYSLIFKHRHPVTLSTSDLQRIAAGEEVIVQDDNTKRHRFSVKLAG